MTSKELAAVRLASKRERAHTARAEARGATVGARCDCRGCDIDRDTIAAATPWLLDYVREGRALPRREHFDLGDLD